MKKKVEQHELLPKDRFGTKKKRRRLAVRLKGGLSQMLEFWSNFWGTWIAGDVIVQEGGES